MRTWTKRDPVKNYFPLPNEIYQLGLSHGAIAVYGYLLRIEDRRTYQCHPSYATIGKAVGMSNNTVRKYVQELEERGLIVTERTSIITQDGRKQNGSLLYTILPIQFSIDQFYQRQMDAVDRAKERQRVARRMEHELRQPALGGQPQFIGCYSAPTVFTASNLKAFSQILCFRMCCTDQFPAPFALCAAVCAFRGWGGVCARQSPLKRTLRRLWAMCESAR